MIINQFVIINNQVFLRFAAVDRIFVGFRDFRDFSLDVIKDFEREAGHGLDY